MDVWTVFSLPFRAYKDETGASAIVLGSKLYIIGGCNQELPAKCFDFQTKLWFTLTNPSVFRSFVRLVVCNGCIYAFGGTENELPGAWNNLIEKYNPQSNLWSRVCYNESFLTFQNNIESFFLCSSFLIGIFCTIHLCLYLR